MKYFIIINTVIQISLIYGLIVLGKLNKKYTLGIKINILLCIFILLLGIYAFR